jgi:adenine phosphoribosyltransferase
MANPFRKSHVDLVCGAESRGFIFGTAIAQTLGTGFIPIRKPGKLPPTRSASGTRSSTDRTRSSCTPMPCAQVSGCSLVDDLLATAAP